MDKKKNKKNKNVLVKSKIYVYLKKKVYKELFFYGWFKVLFLFFLIKKILFINILR